MRRWSPRAIDRARVRFWRKLSAMVARLFERLEQWEDQSNAREFLRRLDDRALRDIGLTRHDVTRNPTRRR
jgi:uncharacterized protein YjiS (DUF1127 family)